LLADLSVSLSPCLVPISFQFVFFSSLM